MRKRYRVLVVSNQSCVGRGLLSRQELQAIARRMLLEVALAGLRALDQLDLFELTRKNLRDAAQLRELLGQVAQ